MFSEKGARKYATIYFELVNYSCILFDTLIEHFVISVIFLSSINFVQCIAFRLSYLCVAASDKCNKSHGGGCSFSVKPNRWEARPHINSV